MLFEILELNVGDELKSLDSWESHGWEGWPMSSSGLKMEPFEEIPHTRVTTSPPEGAHHDASIDEASQTQFELPRFHMTFHQP